MKLLRFISALCFLLAALPAVSQPFADVTFAQPTVAASTPSSPVPELLWWKLNEGSGVDMASSSTGGGSGGTNNATWVSGMGLDFNGTDDAAATTNTLTYATNQITVCFWASWDAVSGTQMILESQTIATVHTWDVFLNGSTLTMAINAGGSRIETLAGETTGQTNHYAITYDKSTTPKDIRLWKNNVEQTLGDGGTSNDTPSNFDAYRVFMGARSTTSLWLNGRIDDVRIYNRILSEAEIGQVYADKQ